MMSFQNLLLFLPACFALNMAPGPNNLLSVSNATRYGFRLACMAGVGRIIAFALMIALAGAGLAVVLHTSAYLFFGIKILGGLYLIYLAFQMWRADDLFHVADDQPLCSPMILMQREFLVAIGNPKAILIFTAFLPQFVSTSQPALPQFAFLGLAFLLLEWIAIALYAYFGLKLTRLLLRPLQRKIFNRTLASLLGAAGIGLLAMKRH